MNAYEVYTIQLASDYEGSAKATLIHKTCTECNSKVVLYIHGYIDYFFQHHIADFFVKRGFHFYALELRKYGRSWMSHQSPNYCRDIHEYFPEIDQAIHYIKLRHAGASIGMLGHSTGGLISSVYMMEGNEKDSVRCLLLNSPFFEFNTSTCKRKIQIPLAATLSYLMPFLKKKNELNPWYVKSISKRFYGEWDYREDWKPDAGFPLYFAWLRAILKAQNQIKKGIHISQPILCLSSDNSVSGQEWSEDFFHGDAVLNVNDIKQYAAGLGESVEYIQIIGGMHDLYLSRAEVRKEALERSVSFFEKYL